jgi:hypothetical protein
VSGQGEPGDDSRRDAGEEGGQDMMAGFRRTSGGVSARFTPAQASIVRTLVSQVAELIGGPEAEPGPVTPGPGPGQAAPGPGELPDAEDPFGPGELAALLGEGGPAGPPDDPVLARLLPDAYQGDPGAAGDFRRYTEHGLRSGKVAAARTVLATLPGRGGRVRLTAQDGEVWLRALNDVRLALGVRLGITEDYEHELGGLSSDDPRAAYLQVYDWLTFLQETLVRALW